MGIEIERKFLLNGDAWRSTIRSSIPIRQGYLSNEQNCSVRVRTTSDRAWLNIKSVTMGTQRQEFEYEISLVDGNQILDTLSRKPLIEKTRHIVEVGKHVWEIDEFTGDNSGLIVAEIELDDPDEAFEKPSWLGEEVTFDPRYYNTKLSKSPYNTW